MSASLDLAAPKLGSGTRFARLSSKLAARGARDPDALAAYIGRKRYGANRMGRLSAGSSHANTDAGIYLAATATDFQGKTLTCPECGHTGAAGDFGVNGASLQRQPGALNTQVPNTAQVRKDAPLTVNGKTPAHALSNTRAAVELAAGTRRHPVQGPMDVLVSRQPDGTSILRHRNGGAEIARMRQADDGRWIPTVNGRDLPARTIQQTALMEAVGQYNGAVRERSSQALQVPPAQTELMQESGIPGVRALATPTTSSSGGPRVTSAGGAGKTYDPDNDGDNDASPSGDTDKDFAGSLSPRGQGIYKKLIAKGFTPARALAFAKNAEKTKAGQFGKSAG